MFAIRLTTVAGLSLATTLFAAEKSATEGGISFTYDDATFPKVKAEEQKKYTSQEAGTDIPDGVGPKHWQFWLWDKEGAEAVAKNPDIATRTSLQVFPLKDPSVPKFAKAYPEVSEGATKLAELLKKAPKEITWISQETPPNKRKAPLIPDMAFVEASPAFQIKLHYFANDQIRGVFFLTEYTQESTFYPTSDNISYTFAGLSKDGRFSVLAEFAVTHPSIPKSFDDAPESAKTGKMKEAELKKVVAALAAQADDTFSPKLGELQAIVGSLKLPAK